MTFGNIFQKFATKEDKVIAKEVQLEIFLTETTRMVLNKKEVEPERYLHMEEECWNQKAGMRWFKEGDRNTKFFHSYVKGRRRMM